MWTDVVCVGDILFRGRETSVGYVSVDMHQPATFEEGVGFSPPAHICIWMNAEQARELQKFFSQIADVLEKK